MARGEREREALAFGKQVTFTTCMLSGSLSSFKQYLEKQCNASFTVQLTRAKVRNRSAIVTVGGSGHTVAASTSMFLRETLRTTRILHEKCC